MTDDVVMLDGDRHEAALCEKRGQFQEVCGCGWRSSWTTDPEARREHETHVAAEKLWARLSDGQRRALDQLVRFESCWAAGATGDGQVNGRAALSLVRNGYAATVRTHPDCYAVTERGRTVHPLANCSVRHGGKPCGYCHACRRRLPTEAATSCPTCGASDWDG